MYVDRAGCHHRKDRNWPAVGNQKSDVVWRGKKGSGVERSLTSLHLAASVGDDGDDVMRRDLETTWGYVVLVPIRSGGFVVQLGWSSGRGR